MVQQDEQQQQEEQDGGGAAGPQEEEEREEEGCGEQELPVTATAGDAGASLAAGAGAGEKKGTHRRPWEHKYKVKCRFCGGRFCLRCSEQCALRYKGSAFNGLHSNWITPTILGMQRPSTRLIGAYQLLRQWTEAGITAVINLTEPGEHPHCGDGLEESSGFPYLPEDLMAQGISHFNFAWEDMTTPSLSLLMDIVRVGSSVLDGGGKIAVHCHAGYGRTGLVICSILVFTEMISADKAIALVREKRPGSVQTSAQVAIVHEFADFVRDVRVAFHMTESARTSLGQFLRQQAFLLRGQESDRLRWVPKPVQLATEMLSSVAKHRPHDTLAAIVGVAECASSSADSEKAWGMMHEHMLQGLKFSANAVEWKPWDLLLESCKSAPERVDIRLPAQLLVDWLGQLSEPVLKMEYLTHALPELNGAEGELGSALSAQDVRALNDLPVGEIRTVQVIVECLRVAQQELLKRGETEHIERALDLACCRLGIALLHLDKAHTGLVVGRTLVPLPVDKPKPEEEEAATAVASAPTAGDGSGRPWSPDLDAALRHGTNLAVKQVKATGKLMGALIDRWVPPRTCRPYSNLEAIANVPVVRHGDEEYWSKRRTSIVHPLANGSGPLGAGYSSMRRESRMGLDGSGVSAAALAMIARSQTVGRGSGNVFATTGGTQEPAALAAAAAVAAAAPAGLPVEDAPPKAMDDADDTVSATYERLREKARRRRSLSSDNIDGMRHLPELTPFTETRTCAPGGDATVSEAAVNEVAVAPQ